MALEREDVLGEVLDLFGRELARLAVGVLGVGDGKHLFHREGAAIVEVGGGAPYFGEGWRVELLPCLRAGADTNVVGLAIGPQMLAVWTL